MTDFNKDIDLSKDIETLYKGKKLVFRKPYQYIGPVTMQYLPYGGIQSLFHGHIIINTKGGFIASDFVNYNDVEMTSIDFINLYPDLINIVLPDF